MKHDLIQDTAGERYTGAQWRDGADEQDLSHDSKQLKMKLLTHIAQHERDRLVPRTYED